MMTASPVPPVAIVLAGYGLNCEAETAHAFAVAGADARIVHVADLIADPAPLGGAQILAVPGGFSYGDDTGSGNALAQTLRLRLGDALAAFVARDTLTIGICNGCQTLVRLGLLEGRADIALTHNAGGRYECRWVDLAPEGDSPWLRGIERLHIPVAHGEGRFVLAPGSQPRVALRYVTADGAPAQGAFPANPNGSAHDIAGVTDASGRVLAMMPHPERGMYAWQRDDAPQRARAGPGASIEADGMALFRNAVGYFGS